MITFLSQGARDWPKTAKTLGSVALAFAENLRPGRRTSMYSIQTLARRHPDWYRHDLATLFAMLADGKLAPQVAAVLSLDEVPAAVTNLAGHGPPGKQVISVAARDEV